MLNGHDTSFTVSSVETFHVVAGGRTYWESFRADNRVETSRFLLKPGWRTVYARQVETALVKVTLADGSVGWGEATEPICPEIICMIAARLLAPVLGGREWESPFEFWSAGYELNRGRGHHSGYQLLALAALDVAIWDALGKRLDCPVAALLSNDLLDAVPLYISGLRRETLAERVELLKNVIGEGASGAKIFVNADTDATARELAGLRDGLAGDWKLMADALWSYEAVDHALAARNRFAQFDVNWLECPLLPEDLEGHRALAAGEGSRVALGETFFTHFQSQPWLEAGALAVFQPDICRTGISDGWQQCTQARARGIAVTPHMGSGSPVVQATALTFAAAVRADEPCEYQFDLSDLLPEVFESAWERNGGHLPRPQVPGLGVTIDEEALRRSAVMVDSWSPG